MPLGNKRPNRPNLQELPTRCRTGRSTWSSCAIRAMRPYQCCASWRAGSSSPGRYPLSTSSKTGGGRRARRQLPALRTPGGRTRSFGQAEPAAFAARLKKSRGSLAHHSRMLRQATLCFTCPAGQRRSSETCIANDEGWAQRDKPPPEHHQTVDRLCPTLLSQHRNAAKYIRLLGPGS